MRHFSINSKKLLAIALCLSMAPMSLAQESAEPNNTDRLWRELNVHTQAMIQEFLFLPDGVQPTYGIHKPKLDAIEESLEKLEKSGAVLKRIFRLDPEVMSKEGPEALADFAESISNEYGIFVANELVGIGSIVRFKTFKKGKPLPLVTHLPKQQMESFEKHLEQHKLLAKESTDH